MIKKSLVTSILILTASAAHADVVLKNTSKYNINEVFVSAASLDNWGDDVLGEDQIFEPGDKFTITGVTAGKWDFRLTFTKPGKTKTYTCDIREVKIGKDGDVSELDSTTLKTCADNTAAAAEDAEGEEE